MCRPVLFLPRSGTSTLRQKILAQGYELGIEAIVGLLCIGTGSHGSKKSGVLHALEQQRVEHVCWGTNPAIVGKSHQFEVFAGIHHLVGLIALR